MANPCRNQLDVRPASLDGVNNEAILNFVVSWGYGGGSKGGIAICENEISVDSPPLSKNLITMEVTNNK